MNEKQLTAPPVLPRRCPQMLSRFFFFLFFFPPRQKGKRIGLSTLFFSFFSLSRVFLLTRHTLPSFCARKRCEGTCLALSLLFPPAAYWLFTHLTYPSSLPFFQGERCWPGCLYFPFFLYFEARFRLNRAPPLLPPLPSFVEDRKGLAKF